MKLKFKQQQFQTDAVNAVADLFHGQERRHSTFSITRDDDGQVGMFQDGLGIGNALLIDETELCTNMHEVQKRNSLPLTGDSSSRQFSIEMETGTGKTYVYTKTIFELHKQYGFTKFIIVVPSVAIREGVYKSLQVTQEHFALAYDNVPCRYFIYNSSKLSDVRQFATSANIEIMIINIDAFKKAENVINQSHEKLNGETAMRYIQDTNPIVIIDEPQSVDNTPKSKDAITSLHPLCVFRYSATHREKINLLYRLTPVDAYQMGLVKQICVVSNSVANDFNKPYIKLQAVSHEDGFRARVEMDVQGKDGKVKRKYVNLRPDSDLFHLSGDRELYAGYAVAGIDCTPGSEAIEFTNTEYLPLGKAIGDINESVLKRAQIRRTVEIHLEKEKRYLEQGIKVLSLFFIDEVKKYRAEDGGKGIYAQMFEACYQELMSLPKFEVLRSKFPASVGEVHDGYFSQDKKGRYKNTRGDTQDDYDTYSTIMKDKERLLSFDCPLRFIFSHSALKEGWDNPNVFQVCTLIEQKSTFTCRQKVGRGLRLCVDQDGERVEDRNINILHVMANESFAEFAATLQKEIEDDTGIKFGILQLGLFSGMTYTKTSTRAQCLSDGQAKALLAALAAEGHIRNSEMEISTELMPELPQELRPVKEQAVALIEKQGDLKPETLAALTYQVEVAEEKTVTYEEAQKLMAHFEEKGYITKTGAIRPAMQEALRSGTLELPTQLESARAQFEAVIRRADRRPPIRDGSNEVTVTLKKEVFDSREFIELWDKIKQKTAYRVHVDSDKLVNQCIKELKAMPPIPQARIVSQTANILVEQTGVRHIERDVKTMGIKEAPPALPDILLILQDECGIPLALCRDILVQSGRLGDFIHNPQLFIEQSIEMIKNALRTSEIDGIRYIKLDGRQYYAQEIFESGELLAYLDKNAVPVNRSVYDYVVYDSETVEKPFALALDEDPDVKMFFKLPNQFKIDTPLGTYNPDWAVYLDCDGEQKLYFVLETKGDTNVGNLRTPEQLKIHCGERHFEAIGDVELRVAKDWKKFKVSI